MMPDPTAPRAVRSYLAGLDRALVGLPADVRQEIVAGIREELDGLDDAAAADRIEALGDPEFIGAEARAEAAMSPSAETLDAEPTEPRTWSTPSHPKGPQRAAQPTASWYPVVTVLLIAGGGYVVPFVGWVIGVTMLWGADAWGLRDKWLGTLAGPLASLAVFGVSAAMQLVSPDGLVGWHSTILGVMIAPLIANVLVGIRLLRRASTSGR